MNLKQYQYVIILAEEGSFSKAADTLHIAQPSLSQYIKKIETQVGFELFNRSNNEVELTEAGRIFLQAAQAILNQEKQMRSQLADLADNHIGHLVVGIAPTRCQYLMPEIVRRFKAVFPGMHIVVEERFMKELMEDAERGVFDLCVATMPVDEQQFDITPMMQEEVILAVPKSLPICDELASGAKNDPSRIHPVIDIVRIDGAPYVALLDTQPTQRQLGELMGKYGFSVKTAVKCMSIETQFTMVKEGIGLALVPSSLTKYSKAESVACFSLAQQLPCREMVVIHRKGQYLSKAAEELKKIMTSI